MTLDREAWDKFYDNMKHPCKESIEARDQFLAEHKDLNIDEILKRIGVEKNAKK